MIVLGIESSCDECAVALLAGDEVVHQVIASQIEAHQCYGGVAPEVASRLHIEQISTVVDQLFTQSPYHPEDIDLVAYTNRPGLMGSLLVGATFAKHFAWALGKPFIAVNHLLAHLFVAKQEHPTLTFPFLGVIASGGHTVIAVVEGYQEDQVKVLGTTLDDAIGECFDKVGKAYGLPYPAGVHVDKLAQTGDAQAYAFPYPKLNPRYAGAYDCSYSGLKNAVINQKEQFLRADAEDSLENIMASFQYVAVRQLVKIILKASNDFSLHQVVIGGGVAANSALRAMIQSYTHLKFFSLPSKLCGDNGQMIAYYGKELFLERGKTSDALDTGVIPRVDLFKYQRPIPS
ncbi:tRNA (adenosine(37)-N6)-threonylcarbamoyltransferase complex transferase subunit TsaD [Spirochaetales bacterium BR151]|uniref:tRNA N6-adenosine threonylcarbamoyltransferase n=2 Tax=Entomospira culicis TaxID=2719989 RepID=A0A968KUL0_9SPIO|nr:tRNA (adenosine(37)-N6)-threonylcarbamoyltransferase complex transferase subunit TsaD [Entomospira culicis]NIZ69230.1 tRNA (adenosine(37)-N6)-threonylcarbamoyltransferase complex transferase subunit TsaD [Entomospira culicis]